MARDWWNYSWNLVTGCAKVSDECRECWAEAMSVRLKAMGRPEYQDAVNESGHWTNRVRLVPERLDDPKKLRKPRIIAVELMGDLFHPDVPFDFIGRVFGAMSNAPWHNYILLTKRPERMAEVVKRVRAFAGVFGNVWLGTSAGTQVGANERWAPMSRIAESGWNTWVSSEPRLEPIDWHGWEFLKQLITGGESGSKSRIMVSALPRADREWCRLHHISWMFKQWGDWVPLSHLAWVTDETRFKIKPIEVNGELMVWVGKPRAGHVLDGQEYRQLAWAPDGIG